MTYNFAQPLDAAINKDLAADAQWGIDLLAKLMAAPKDALTAEAIDNCEGLAFMHMTKGGLVLTAAMGEGFVIRKVKKDPLVWSAPIPLTMTQIGVGLSAGFDKVESILVLNTPEAVFRFSGDQYGYAAEAGPMTKATEEGYGGVASGGITKTSTVAKVEGSKKQYETYSFAKGLLVNVAVHDNETTPNYPKLNKMYDMATVKLPEVLLGKTPTFEPMLPLYEKLVTIAGTAKKPEAAAAADAAPESH